MRLKRKNGEIIHPYNRDLYVAPNGNDTAVGDSTHPLATVSKAIQLGATRVILAAGNYTEHVVLTNMCDIEVVCKSRNAPAVFVDARAQGGDTNAFTISGCSRLKVTNVTASGGDLNSFYTANSDGIIFERCVGSNSLRGNGFHAESSTIFYYACLADDNTSSGFSKSSDSYAHYEDCLVDGSSYGASGGSGSGSGGIVPTPTAQQAGYVAVAKADGTVEWKSLSSLLTAWTPNNPYGGGN